MYMLMLTLNSRAWFNDLLNKYLSGRHPAIFVAGFFSLFPAIGVGACRN
jgi:hypothetical protein